MIITDSLSVCLQITNRLNATKSTKQRSLAKFITRIEDFIDIAKGFSHNTCLFASNALMHKALLTIQIMFTLIL